MLYACLPLRLFILVEFYNKKFLASALPELEFPHRFRLTIRVHNEKHTNQFPASFAAAAATTATADDADLKAW